MANGIIQLSPDSTGKKVDTEELVVGANTVHRERMQIAGDSDTDIAAVTAADGLTVNLGTNNDVTVASLPLPSGAATLTEQQTQSTALAAIETAVELIDNAISGTELQVDVVAALPAGTNNIGDVDIASLPNEGQQTMAGSISVAIASDQSAVPVSGTVAVTGSATLAEQQTQTTHLAAIETAVEIIDNAVAGSEMQVDVVAALPAGTNNIGDVDVLTVPAPLNVMGGGTEAAALRVTLANDSTGVVSVDDNGGALTVDGTVTANAGTNLNTSALALETGGNLAAAVTALQILDNVVSGSEAQVDIVGALPTGTNNIGDVDVLTLPSIPAGTNNIGDVDVLSVIPGTAATNLGKAIDSVPGATDTGVVALGVRDDALTTLTPADGDYTQLRVDSTGALWTRSTSAAGGTSATDEDAYTAGTSTGTPVMGAFDDAASDVLAEDTLGIIRATTARGLHVNLRDASGNEVSVGGGTQYTEDAAAAANPIGTALNLIRQDALSGLVTTDGDNVAARGTNNGELYVKHVDAIPVTDNGGALTVDGTVAVTGVSTLAEQQTQTTHLATIAGDTTAIETAVQIMDDWDESDRAKVNPIVGQAGVAAGAGAVGVTVQRVTLASDDPAVAALQILDNAIAGSEMQVDIVAALPAGTNNIGDVDVLSSALPTGASTLAEQQTQTTHLATIAGDTTDIEAAVELLDDTVKVFGTDTYTEATTKGLTIGAVRRDADTSLVDTTNEVAPLQVDALGRLKVEVFSGETLPVSGTVAVTGVATETTLASALTALQIMDDWDETDRAKVNPIAGQAGVQGASGTVTALTQRVVLATDVGLPAGTANIGDVDVLTLPALVAGSANIGDVDIASAPTGSSSISVQGTAANAAAAVGNPVYVGGRASTALPTDVGADGDVVSTWLNRNGLQVVSAIPGAGLNADPYTLLSVTAQYTTTQTSAVLLAGGASERIIVTSIQIQVGGTTAGTLQVYFGTGAYSRGTNSAIFDGEFAPSATLKPGYSQSPPSGYRSPTLGHDVLVTDSAAINPLTITIWYYILGV